jgi:histidyl-tRNA synthetase
MKPPLYWPPQAEFAYKQKPKLPAQFKAAEAGDVPFAVILGEEELAQGKVRIKELGLREGHPEKDGVLVDMSDLVKELKERLRRKHEQGPDADADVSVDASGRDSKESGSGSGKREGQEYGIAPSETTGQETLPIRDHP